MIALALGASQLRARRQREKLRENKTLARASSASSWILRRVNGAIGVAKRDGTHVAAPICGGTDVGRREIQQRARFFFTTIAILRLANSLLAR